MLGLSEKFSSVYISAYIALRYLKSKRKEVFVSIITVISVVGVSLSVAVLDVVLSIMTGFEEELQAKLVSSTPHLIIRQFGGGMRDWRSVVDILEKIPGVESSYPYTNFQAMLAFDGRTQGILIRGVVDLDAAKNSLVKLLTPESDLADLFSPPTLSINRPDGSQDQIKLPPLILGRNLLKILGLELGDTVTLFSAQMTSSPRGLIPKMRRFVVVGAYASGLLEFENGLAYAKLEDTQAFFGKEGEETVTGVIANVFDVFQAKSIGEDAVNRLNSLGGGYDAVDWTIPQKPLWDALRLEKRVYYIVLLLLILVASFSIVSTMVMIVMEKGRDIAILKTMGATDKMVLYIFLLQGALIGVIGTAFGTLVGYLGCLGLREYGFELDEAVFSLNKVPVHIIPQNFILVTLSALVITAGAGIYPALRAARVQPARSMRYE